MKPTDFQEILDHYKKIKGVGSAKKTKNPKLRNCKLQIADEVDEFNLSPKKQELCEAPLVSPNLTEILDSSSPAKSFAEKSLVFNFQTEEETKPIFTISRYQNPNIHSQGVAGMEEEYSTAKLHNNSVKFNINYKNNNCSYDLENISQRINSLSLSDKMILEANQILSDCSVNSKFMNLFSNSISQEKSTATANCNPIPKPKSIFYLKARMDPMFLNFPEDEVKSKISISNAEENVMYDFEWDNNNIERGSRSRCKTQKMDAVQIQERIINPTMVLLRKKKSQTYCEQNETFLNQ